MPRAEGAHLGRVRGVGRLDRQPIGDVLERREEGVGVARWHVARCRLLLRRGAKCLQALCPDLAQADMGFEKCMRRDLVAALQVGLAYPADHREARGRRCQLATLEAGHLGRRPPMPPVDKWPYQGAANAPYTKATLSQVFLSQSVRTYSYGGDDVHWYWSLRRRDQTLLAKLPGRYPGSVWKQFPKGYPEEEQIKVRPVKHQNGEWSGLIPLDQNANWPSQLSHITEPDRCWDALIVERDHKGRHLILTEPKASTSASALSGNSLMVHTAGLPFVASNPGDSGCHRSTLSTSDCYDAALDLPTPTLEAALLTPQIPGESQIPPELVEACGGRSQLSLAVHEVQHKWDWLRSGVPSRLVRTPWASGAGYPASHGKKS